MTELSPLPLKGVRIADLTWALASAGTSTLLASLGAEVIRIEWPERMGPLLPHRRLEVALALGLHNGRQARLAGDPSWTARIKEIGLEQINNDAR